MTKRKAKRGGDRPHPRNRYAETPPDFADLASRYESFAQFVRWGSGGRASIDWCDYNATRELTRVLLDHDYGIKWWIPDGQLCPTVTNRANYIHWIEDLLAEFPSLKNAGNGITGVDIGTGASCIYPLLGSSLCGWKFVGTDVTSVALEWAAWNVEQNPHLSGLIQVRDSRVWYADKGSTDVGQADEGLAGYANEGLGLEGHAEELNPSLGHADEGQNSSEVKSQVQTSEDGHEDGHENEGVEWQVEEQGKSAEPEGYEGRRSFQEQDTSMEASNSLSDNILVGVLKEGETFDFCMCNPPFFESMDEAGLNPRTALGGTEKEMVFPGGEAAFVSRLIADSVQLGTTIHWYTTMVGKKGSLKVLTSQLRNSGVTMLRTTEFVQGRTSRWGLAWSFSPPPAASTVAVSNGGAKASFMLDGLNRQCSAWDVLQSLAGHLEAQGATCVVDKAQFSVSGTLLSTYSESGKRNRDGTLVQGSGSKEMLLRFTVTVLQQAPGCLLVKASGSNLGEGFVSILKSAEVALREQFSSRGRQKIT